MTLNSYGFLHQHWDSRREQSEQVFLDPIEGSWIVHVTVDTYTPNPGFYATLPVRRSPVILGKWHHYYFRSY